MTEDRVIVFCLNFLRWLGLSFTAVRRTRQGDLVSKSSKLNFLFNVAIVGVLLFVFFQVKLNAYGYTAEVYKTSAIVYPLYTKLMIVAIVVLSLSGNVYNQKIIGVLNLFRRVSRELECEFGHPGRRKDRNGFRILVQFFSYLGVTTALNLWTDSHLTIHYERIFRVVHYLGFYYVTFFTAHFVITMNYVKENFGYFNAVFGRITFSKRNHPSISAAASEETFLIRRKLGAWMAGFMDLREVEGLVNEAFGKQIFLTFLLAFSSVIVNAYYYISLNLYGTSYLWLNVTMWFGFVQSMMLALLNTRAAELAANEANRINEVIFSFPVHLNNWKMFDRIKYFALFNRYHPVEFKAWIFYAINYDSFLKVILTSSAITAVIIQCDFLKGNLEGSNGGKPERI